MDNPNDAARLAMLERKVEALRAEAVGVEERD